MPLNTNKDLKTYYSIGEVAEMLGVKETLLRFWERKFPKELCPKKAGRNIRQYTKKDIDQLKMIYNLLKVRGLKIEAAQELLRKNKEGTAKTVEAVNRLKEIQKELLDIKEKLDTLQ